MSGISRILRPAAGEEFMSWPRFFHRARRDAELTKDIQFYLDAETDDNIARGMPADIARERARRKFGNPTHIREEVYRMNGARFLETLWQDGLYALRMMRRKPIFTAMVAATLALGIGANAAVFSILQAVVLQPLPYKNPFAPRCNLGQECSGRRCLEDVR